MVGINYHRYYNSSNFFIVCFCTLFKHCFVFSAPDPPSNLTIITRGGKQASVSWSPPLQGHHSGYKLRLISLSEPSAPLRNLPVEDDTSKYVIRDLHPGATYQLQAYTVFEGKESVAYTSTNFTTSAYYFFFICIR